ncbi:hypothetical protein [Acetonema longum]|uniref:Uncharacterized protein n=1 Tax=Acetonema longum DSM 6540 TaxID=1009370 RepID=F7NJK2_9FIRM|nr:hypothetical protein [Acetonema longum]EGO63780.1 hypothetical protein ALO_11289 [Acetonema longum DSM 6540]
MKFIGSKTEQDFRNQLINSHKALFQERENQRLLNVMRSYFPDMKTAYIIGWTPEQSEDIYVIFIDAKVIAVIELDRYNVSTQSVVEIISLEQYMRKLSRIGQIQLAVAIDLSQKDLSFKLT